MPALASKARIIAEDIKMVNKRNAFLYAQLL